jgi:flagellar motor switch protein FliM
MADKSKPEMAPQRRSLKLSPALGDWTSYKPARSLIKKIKVGLYGFDRLSDDELNEAHLIHYRFGENLLKNLKINYRFGGELYSIEAMQSTYGNFQKSITGPLLQGKIEVIDFHENITFCVDTGLISTIINSSLGCGDTKNLGAELTEAEKIVVQSAFSEYLASSLNLAFQNALSGAHFDIVASPDFVPDPYISASSTFVYFVVEMSFGETQGKIIIGYSGNLIKSLLKKIKAAEKPKPLALNRVKAEILNKTLIPVDVILGSTELKGSEIYQLEIGDVVSLDNSIYNAIQIRLAEDGITILAQPGVKEGKIIARVVGVEKEKEIKVAPPLPETPPPEVEEETPKEEEEEFEEEIPEEEISKELAEEEELPEEEFEEEEFPEEELLEEEEFPEEKIEEEFKLNEEEEGENSAEGGSASGGKEEI